jgi:hypothetical protein
MAALHSSTLFCAQCAKPFSRYPSIVQRNKSQIHFCSRACHTAFAGRSGMNTACAQCHAPLYRKPSSVSKTGKYFCSQTCHMQFRHMHHRYADLETRATWVARFWSHIVIAGTNECWLWQDKLNPKTGYASFHVPAIIDDFPDGCRKHCYAHRIAYFLQHHALDHALLVCHTCDVRHCMNGRHLFQGTQRENTHDAFIKGRRQLTGSFAEGKLSAEDVARIQERYAEGGITQKALAAEYGVTQNAIQWHVRKLVKA